jgi:hypothetical protein
VAGGAASTVAGGFGGTAEVLLVGADEDEVDGVVVDSIGRVVVAAGVGVRVGGFFGGAVVVGAVVRTARGATRRRSAVTGVLRRGSDSMMNRVFAGVLTVGSGVGLGRASAGGSSWSGRSGSGRIALELTGPPARLTLISPP